MQILVSGENLTELKDWFEKYVLSFYYNDPELQQNIELKRDHTLRVCEEMVALGKQVGLYDDALRLAEIIALLHDIGRFEQYDRYRTFSDKKSENHAELGMAVIKKHGILDPFDNAVKDLILKSVQYHNRPSLPADEPAICLFYVRLLRDADKLDIWKVVTDYYYRKDRKRNGTIELDLPDTPGFSDEVYQDMLHKRIVDIKHVRNLNDFKLLQIGWIFDINFQPTMDRIKERRYLELIRDVLPASEKTDRVFEVIHEFSAKKEKGLLKTREGDDGLNY